MRVSTILIVLFFILAIPTAWALSQLEAKEESSDISLEEINKKLNVILSHIDERMNYYPTTYDSLRVSHSEENSRGYIHDTDEIRAFMGTSMIPTINPGNTIFVRYYKGQGLHAGDIVCFNRASQSICHRITSAYPNYIETKGDNNPVGDGQILYDDVESIVINVAYTNEFKDETTIY